MKESDSEAKGKASTYHGVTYGDQHDDTIEPQIDLSEQFGDDTRSEIELELYDRVHEPSQKRLSEKGVKRLREIFKRHIGVFGFKLGTNPPVDIKHFEVQLREDAKPTRATQRRYIKIHQLLRKKLRISSNSAPFIVIRAPDGLVLRWPCGTPEPSS